MRRSACLPLLASALLAAQSPGLDEGRLDPSWFGPGVVFQPSKALGFQWLKPELDLRNRSLHLKAWEPAAWLLGRRAQKDQWFLERAESTLLPEMERALRRELKGSLPLSLTDGDLLLSARAVDAVGALRRIEGLKRDGLLSEEECQLLRKKAAEKAGVKAP